MTILLHGDDIVRSRQRFREIQVNSSADGPLFSDKPVPEVIWEGKKLSAAQIAKLKKSDPELKVEEFTLPPIVFKFVESIRPGNQKEMLTLWRQYSSREEAEMAMAMICRQVRLLLSPGGDLPPWQMSKLEKQAKYFGTEKLIKMQEELLTIDYRAKTGFTGVSLSSQLELWLLSL